MWYLFTRCSLKVKYMFRPSSIGHHQVISLYRGNYTIYVKKLIPNYAKIKIPNTCPAATFTQRKIHNLRIKDGIKYLYIKKKQQLNRQLYYLHFIHSFSSLSYDRSKASSKTSSPHSAIQSFLFQMRVSSPFLKVIQ